MANKYFTEEEEIKIAELLERYKNGEKMAALTKEYGFDASTMYKRADNCGIPRQHPKMSRGRNKFIKCTKCGNDKNIRGAKFCFNCGADIRDNILILIDKLQDALANTKFLPDGIREDVSETIREAMAEFKKRVK